MKKYAVLPLFILLLSGCVSKLSNFTNDQKLTPESNMGVVVIAYDSDTAIHSLVFSGPSTFELEHNLYDNKHNYVVTSFPAGTYDITKAKIYSKYYYINLGSDEDANWKINIKPNKVNYIGHFNIDKVGSGYKVQIKNSTTLALEFLQENYQDLITRYGLVYSKDGPDDEFLTYLDSLKGEE
ncbi:hypothetical protein [Kangiella spongicola]|uniref:DUF2846 domain-containing protein n=1 Tax=Kangiella spongicola TaxID=796379 RepID=A0A318D1Q4_9GAMM|nr:hypothetical protein [Kangiella spongicola]PXF63080.1 hypothetical protein DL796_06410 [Kangiella spongicola]